MVGGSKQSSSSRTSLETKRLPGLFEDPTNVKGQQLADELLSFTRGFPPTQRADISSPFAGELENRLLGGGVPELSVPQQALINQAIGLTGGNQAARGLTSRQPPSQASLVGAIAPTLASFFQQNVGNLQNALAGERGANLQQQNVFQTGEANQRQQIIQVLSDLIGVSLPQIVAGQQGTASSSGFGFGIGTNLSST